MKYFTAELMLTINSVQKEFRVYKFEAKNIMEINVILFRKKMFFYCVKKQLPRGQKFELKVM